MEPGTWPETLKFLVEEQRKLESLEIVKGGIPIESDEVDMLCLQYASTKQWPPGITEKLRKGILQRFVWARNLAALLMLPLQKADGTETVSIAVPDWGFDDMMVWFLVDSWKSASKFSNIVASPHSPRPSHPEPPVSLN